MSFLGFFLNLDPETGLENRITPSLGENIGSFARSVLEMGPGFLCIYPGAYGYG